MALRFADQLPGGWLTPELRDVTHHVQEEAGLSDAAVELLGLVEATAIDSEGEHSIQVNDRLRRLHSIRNDPDYSGRFTDEDALAVQRFVSRMVMAAHEQRWADTP